MGKQKEFYNISQKYVNKLLSKTFLKTKLPSTICNFCVVIIINNKEKYKNKNIFYVNVIINIIIKPHFENHSLLNRILISNEMAGRVRL